MKSVQLCLYLRFVELYLNDYGDDFMIMIMKKTSYDAVYDQPYISVPKTSEFQSGPRVVKKVLNTQSYQYLWLTIWFHTSKSKEMLKKTKSLILLYKIGSKAQKWLKIAKKTDHSIAICSFFWMVYFLKFKKILNP